MDRPSSPWATGSVTDRFDDHRPDIDDEYDDDADYEAYADYDEDDDFNDYAAEHGDRHWLWVAGVAGIVLLIAVAGTLMILSGGDSGTTSATVSPSTSRAAPYPSAAPSPSTSRAPSATALPPETITSVSPTPTAAPSTAPTEAAPPAAADPRTVTYQVTGSRQLLDLVTVIYTDQQGALQTAVNVALPWTKQVVLDPGVELSSVTATSVTGQLNCTITDGSGATLAAQTNNSIITNCTR
ncbi:MAG TPA: MmpS family transport accessory protein [Mycobacterium sp.]|nr:MmpS family transport accessory protein [Mycobacterium sp.]